jgi:hypothetical protein
MIPNHPGIMGSLLLLAYMNTPSNLHQPSQEHLANALGRDQS